MPLTVHHLQFSQSERIPWLCEELNIPYNLVLHKRDPVFAPQSIKDLNPVGQAPVIQDGTVTLAESAACTEYIIQVHGNGKLALPPTHKNYTDYLYWFHFANGTLQLQAMVYLQLSRVDPSSSNPATARAVARLKQLLKFVDDRLNQNTWLAGDEFTAADIMTVFTLTTMRAFLPIDLTPYKGILAYLESISQREGYKKARAKADPELELMIDGKPPKAFGERLKEQGKI